VRRQWEGPSRSLWASMAPMRGKTQSLNFQDCKAAHKIVSRGHNPTPRGCTRGWLPVTWACGFTSLNLNILTCKMEQVRPLPPRAQGELVRPFLCSNGFKTFYPLG
jgi:hypothetical protein